MRPSAIYGVDYRYTTAFGLASYQLLKDNKVNGYDFPMLYGELFIPQVASGLVLRLGRFVSVPDIGKRNSHRTITCTPTPDDIFVR